MRAPRCGRALAWEIRERNRALLLRACVHARPRSAAQRRWGRGVQHEGGSATYVADQVDPPPAGGHTAICSRFCRLPLERPGGRRPKSVACRLVVSRNHAADGRNGSPAAWPGPHVFGRPLAATPARPTRHTDIRPLDAGDRPAGPASSFAVGLGQGRSHPCLSRLWAKKEKYSCGGDFFL